MHTTQPNSPGRIAAAQLSVDSSLPASAGSSSGGIHTMTMNRRAMLRGIAATTAAGAAVAVPAAIANASTATDVDAVLAAWRAWRPLAEEFARLSDEAERIEKSMPDWARSGPHIAINDVQVYSPHSLDQAMKQLPDWLKPASEQLRECALRGWNEGWARAEAERARVGLAPRRDRMDEITDLEDPLITLIENASGSHPVVVAAKMDMALNKTSCSDLFEDLPWSLLASAVRGVLSDLPADMAEALAPIAAGHGMIGEIYDRGAAERRAMS